MRSRGAAAARPSRLVSRLPLTSRCSRLGRGEAQAPPSESQLSARRRLVRRADAAARSAPSRAADVSRLQLRSRRRRLVKPAAREGTLME